MINEILEDDNKDGRRIIPIALGLSAGGLKIWLKIIKDCKNVEKWL